MVARNMRVPHWGEDDSHPFEAGRRARVRVQQVPMDAVTEAECVAWVMEALQAGRGGWVITPNLDHVRRAQLDPEFRQMLEEADMVVADGMPLIWASRVRGTPLPERVAGSALVWTLSEAAAAHGRSIFFLGGDPGTAEGSARVLQARYPGLRVAGTCCPTVGFERDPGQLNQLRQNLRASGADIVYVALGSPKQERLIRALRGELPGAWWLGVGISFSFLTGRVRRAPRWMQRTGLEWAHRLAQEPRRLGRRYLVEGLPFVARLLCSAGVQRCSVWVGSGPLEAAASGKRSGGERARA